MKNATTAVSKFQFYGQNQARQVILQTPLQLKKRKNRTFKNSCQQCIQSVNEIQNSTTNRESKL